MRDADIDSLNPVKKSPRGRLASGAPNPVDAHIGRRLRFRRMMIGLSQEAVAAAIGVAFQQVQKYESAINRISMSRLWDISRVLQCPVSFFYEGMDSGTAGSSPRHVADGTAPAEMSDVPQDITTRQETLRLVRAYYTIRHEPTRKQILNLATCLARGMATKTEAAAE